MKENTPTNLLENLNKLHYSSRRLAMELSIYKLSGNTFSQNFVEEDFDLVVHDLGVENCLSFGEVFQQLIDSNIIETVSSPELDLNLKVNPEYLEILTEELESLVI
jgi:hypothetical protein